MRAFIGIPVEGIFLTNFQEMMIQTYNSFRPDRAGFHITIEFFSDIGDRVLKQIYEKCNNVNMKSGTYKICGPEGLPNSKYARVACFMAEGKDLFEIYRQVRENTPENLRENRNFRPHITLGRFKREENLEKFKERMEETEIKFTSLVFYESVLNSSGALHNEIYRIQLM
ncbi:RNA 2',3'-cyclic phosphodiesterase [Caldiplasma sukawensis]